MELTLFQQDLRNGMTIKEALQKHRLTFQEAVNNIPRPIAHPPQKKKKPQKKKGNAGKYIQRRGDHYYVRRTFNKKTQMFGTYSSIEDATRIRDHCNTHGWIQTNIDQYCKELNIERCKDHRNCTVRYS